MRWSPTTLEIVAIAAMTAGIALLWSLGLDGFATQHKLLILVGMLLVAIAIVKHGELTTWLRSAKPLPRSHEVTVSHHPQPVSQGVSMQEMRRYFAWLEKKLNELMIREGLECGLVRVKRGPLVITLQLRLINPTQRDLQKLMKLGPALAQLLHVDTVRLADTSQGIMVEVPSPKPRTPNGALLARHTRKLSLPLGVNTAAHPVLVNLEDHGALFWVGPSRRGKTQSMKSALYAVLRENIGHVQFIIIASPAKVTKDWSIFMSVVGCLGIAYTKEDIAAATQWVVTMMNSPHHAGTDVYTLLVVDDLPNILKAVPQIRDDLADIASMGAGLGIHLLVGTQAAGSKRTSGGTDIETNVTARILFRPATSRTGSQSAGVAGLSLHDLSSAKGDAVALIDGHATRIATAWILERDIALLPEQATQSPPWQMQNQERNNRQRNADIDHSKQSKQTRTGWNSTEQGQKQPETTQNSHRTGQNKEEQPYATVSNGYAVPQNGHSMQARSEHVLEQPAKQPSEQGIETYLRYLAGLSIEELKNINLGIDASRFPTADEQQIIANAYYISDSVRKTCFMVYGHYNGKVRDYIKNVIDSDDEVAETQASVAPSADAGIPDFIDLNTPRGRAMLKTLQSNGLINWPDADDLLSEPEE